MASAHHGDQASLEGIIDFSSSPPLDEDHRIRAEQRLYILLRYFEENPSDGASYNRPSLIRQTYEFATTEKSKNNVLQAIFNAVGLPTDGPAEIDFQAAPDLVNKLNGFADYLLHNFFLPLKASTRQTPQPSPAYSSATRSVGAGNGAGNQEFATTTARLKKLRGDCLRRDRHRCVITRRFDLVEGARRRRQDGDNATDDDGQTIMRHDFAPLEVAHILPHSLVKGTADTNLSTSRAEALRILNMFDTNISHLIEGPQIDRPCNALTLSGEMHIFFGRFDIYFEPVVNEANTYRIDAFDRALVNVVLPQTRQFFLTEDRVIEPPSPRLLAVHRAVAHILHLSAAGYYIDRVLDDVEEVGVGADGSTPLGELVQLRMDGWIVA